MGLTLRGAGRRGVVPSPLSSLFLQAFVLVLVLETSDPRFRD
jgi:hypothetical protein